MLLYPNKAIIKALLATWGLFIAPAIAAEPTAVDTSNEKPLLEQTNSQQIKGYLLELEKMQTFVGSYVQDVGEGVDRFFGSEDLDVVHKGNRLIVYAPMTFYDNGDSEASVNFRAQFDLPRTNHRWSVLVSSFEGGEDENQNSISEQDISLKESNLEADDTQNTLAGRYLVKASKNSFTHIDLGLKFINYIEPNPYIKYRTRYKTGIFEETESRTTQTFYVERDRGFAWEGQQVFDMPLEKDVLARSQTTLTWWREDEELLINQKAILFNDLSPYRAHAYFIDADWQVNNEDINFEQFSLGMNWREHLYQDWLFGEIEPKVSWVDEDGQFNKPLYSLRMLLEMHFYQPK